MTRARDIANLISGPVSSDRDNATPLIINGDMAIWQRGTALSSNPGNYACDRFWYSGTGMTSQRSTDVPSGFVYSNKLTYGSADMSIGQPIELPATGKQGIFIAGQTLTIAFYGKVDSGTESINVVINARNSKFSGTDSTAFSTSDSAVTLTTAWQRFTKTFTIPTINANNVMLAFELAQISKTAYITGVQAEIGTFDDNNIPDFQFEDRETSLARCQRYCYQEDNSDTFHNQVNGFYSATTLFIGLLALPVALRSTPTLVTSGSYVCAGTSGLSASSLIIADSTGTDLTKIQIRATVSGATAGQGTALRNLDDTNAIFRLDSEL